MTPPVEASAMLSSPSLVDRVAVVGTGLVCAADPSGALSREDLAKVCRSACVVLHRIAGEIDAEARG